MAQLALAVAGAAIGSLAGPLGTSIGWAVGSMAGSLLDPQQVQGPRLADTQVQLSSYGAGIPRTWGGNRVAGVVMWSTDLEEHETESGGKGGPTATTFSYTVSCAVVMNDGPIGAIRKIWADTKLVYDISEDADAATQAASAEFAEYMTVYYGSETQDPDPTIEAAEGAGNVPGYRGLAYVVFTDLPLADYGNRIPNFTFEITTEEAEDAETEYIEPRGVPAWRFNPSTGIPEPTPADGGEPTGVYTVSRPFLTGVDYDDLASALAAALANGDNDDSGNDAHGNALADKYVGFFTGTNSTPSFFSGGATLDDDPEYVHLIFITMEPHLVQISMALQTDSYVGCGDCLGAGLGPYDDTIILTPSTWDETNGGITSMASFYGSSSINACFLTYPGVGPPTPTAYRASANVITIQRLERCAANRCAPGDPCASPSGIAELPGSPFCLSCDGSISLNAELDPEAGTYKQLNLDEWGGSGTSRYRIRPAQGPVLRSTDPDYSNQTFWDAAAASAVYGAPSGGYSASGAESNKYPQIASTACVGTAEAQTAAAGSVLLSQIVSDICVEAGLTTGQIDVTQLTDEVQGFTRANPMTARAALEPLRQAYWFDGVQSGNVIKFVKRGGASVATLTLDDLGATEGDSAEPIDHERGQETELPATVSVTYPVRAADYQLGTQRNARLVTESTQHMLLELPVVLTDQKAAEVADVLLYDGWVRRNQRRFSTTREHAALESTDIVTLDDGELQYVVMIVDKVENGPVIEFTAVDHDAAIYSPDSVASPTHSNGAVIRYYGPTQWVPLDVPLLRADDDGAGFYMAAGSYTGSFRGARLFRSTDGGSSWVAVAELTRQSIIGTTVSALGDYYGGNTIDEFNTLDVTVHGGSLSTITRAALLNGGNAAVLINSAGEVEVFQYLRSTQIDTDRYRLSGLLRGRLGTDVSAHLVGERFVALSELTTQYLAGTVAQIDQEYVYKAVTYGMTSAIEVEFTDTGRSIAPLAPVHLAAGTIGGGQYRVQWARQSRYGFTWRDGQDASLAETSERYRVSHYSGGVLQSASDVTTTTADVTAVAGDVVTVQQISDLFGPGAVASVTLP